MGGMVINENWVSVWEVEKVLEMDRDDRYTKMWTYLMLQNCTLTGYSGKFYVVYIFPWEKK